MPMPVSIVALHRPTFEIEWEDGHATVLPAREVRLACRCASCIEEMTGRPLLDPTSVPADVAATAIHLVGQYAVNIHWTDGHTTGIHSFRALREACRCAACAKEADARSSTNRR